MIFTQKIFGHTSSLQPVFLYRLENEAGAYIEVLNYGCRIRSICVPDKDGRMRNVCLGYNSLEEYENDTEYYGAAVGRCSNLISNAGFCLNSTYYALAANAGAHHLHGGPNGFAFFKLGCYEARQQAYIQPTYTRFKRRLSGQFADEGYL